ncbi:zinc finger, CCHC-type containing protein [Tanacetum coccineum]
MHIRDPELIKEILLRPGDFHKPHPEPFRDSLIGGLLVAEDHKWAKHRKIINPAFNLQNLKIMFSAIKLSCHDMIHKLKLLTAESGSTEVDVWPYIDNLAGDVISRTAFGSNYEEGKKVFRIQKEQKDLMFQMLNILHVPGRRFIPTRANKKFKQNHDELQRVLKGIRSNNLLWKVIARLQVISGNHLCVVYVLTTPVPEDGENATVDQMRNKWDNDDYVCRCLVLKDSLEVKYMAEDASSKKFLVSNFTNYKMTDSRPVMKQYNELLGILERFTQHKINMDEAIQVSRIIDKLHPSWKDFKHTLKHLKEKLTLVELDSYLRIEESLKTHDIDKPKGHNVVGPQLNIVNNISKSAFMSTSKLNDSVLWHARLGYVHFKRMQDMSNDGLILAFDMDTEKAVVRLPDPKLKTLGERGIEYIFVGYAEHSKAFRFYVIESNDSVLINSIIELRDAIFDENRFSSVPRPSLSIPKGTEDIGGSVVPEESTDEVVQQPEPELRKSKRNRTPKDFGPKFQLYLIEGTRDEDVAFWKEAINDEMDFILGNNTWVLADLPLVARISTIRLLIAMTSIHNLIIHQMDVKTDFLNGDLDDEVYMNQPQGFIMPGNENKVCKLIKSLYGLKQVDLTKEYLSSGFFMKDMREADVILGIRIKHKSNEISISQSHYIEKVLKKFNYFDCTPVSTPMDTSDKLMPNNGQAASQLEYSRVIGWLMYAMTCTRPDIAFAVGKLSRYTSNPGTQHWQEIQRVLKYLKKTMDYKLTYTGYPSVLEGYTNASWISNSEDNSSTSGWVFLLGGGATSWASKKQTCITGSTMKSEFVALAATGKKLNG